MQAQHAPRSDRARRRSRAQGDRLVSPRRAETRRKAAPARASAAPSSLASAANRVRATESPFAKAINGLLQQNRHVSHSRDVRLESAKCAKAEIDWSGHDHGRPSPRKTAPDDAARERTGAFTIYAN